MELGGDPNTKNLMKMTVLHSLCACPCEWCGTVLVVWRGLCGVAWRGVAWCGVVWYGVVWCGVVWCGVVWCGVINGTVARHVCFST